MNCRRARHLLFDFFDGVSNEALRAEVDRHLGECQDCDRFASEMTRSLALLRRVPMEPLDENFNWKVRLAIHREKNAALERAASANAWVRAWNVR
jgi:predicted anti-sigma-YlaC factor YlaD